MIIYMWTNIYQENVYLFHIGGNTDKTSLKNKKYKILLFRELTNRGKELASKDPRSELGYRLTVQVDSHDPARPLSVVHIPSLGNKVTVSNSLNITYQCNCL